MFVEGVYIIFAIVGCEYYYRSMYINTVRKILLCLSVKSGSPEIL